MNNNKRQYPYTGICTNTAPNSDDYIIVYFVGEKYGVLLECGKNTPLMYNKVGLYSRKWYEAAFNVISSNYKQEHNTIATHKEMQT